jgi:hypothetical protein
MLLLYKKIVEAMWEVAENDPSAPWGPPFAKSAKGRPPPEKAKIKIRLMG